MTALHPPVPSLAEMEAMAGAALAQIPTEFGGELGNVVVQVEEFADPELLAQLGIGDPMRLSGVYQGVPLHLRTLSDTGRLPDRIRLFRQPILREWAARGNVTIEQMVWHVLVHEIGHHFGLTDATMHALEDAAVREQAGL